jgi:hypothetical protein
VLTDVDAVEERHHVEEDQDREEAEVELADQLLLPLLQVLGHLASRRLDGGARGVLLEVNDLLLILPTRHRARDKQQTGRSADDRGTTATISGYNLSRASHVSVSLYAQSIGSRPAIPS